MLIDNNRKKFDECVLKANRNAISKLRDKEIIHVGFLVYSASIWPYDSLYRLMENDRRFEPIIVICALNDGTDRTILEQYNTTKEWFLKKNCNVLGIFRENENLIWDKLNLDMVFSAIPYTNLLPSKFEYGELRVNIPIIYIPYGAAINEMSDRYFNMKIHNIAWKLFYETDIQKNIAEKKADNNGVNVIVSGYPKMDVYFEKGDKNFSNLWKGNDNAKKIIYAPHHSLMRKTSRYATFDENYLFMLDYVRNHTNDTSWIIKPHPLLKKACLEYGLFKSEEEYDRYLNEWEALPNAKVVLTGDYLEYFISSDAMVLDSESFLYEYQYTHKPLLFLTRPTQSFNEFGRKLLNILYKVPGGDKEKIFEFLDNVVLNGNDTMESIRLEFFNEYLDYRKQNNGLGAGEFIFAYLKDQVTKR